MSEFYAYDKFNRRQLLTAPTAAKAITEVEENYYLRRTTVCIKRVSIKTIWSADEAAD
ncbi:MULTISPECIES: hypothetical protein [unclassified Mesorhizobium]|jgi:adenine-specific DNA methylase|uniref:hypothetical protein n=1 Tax=unclassified Mesorhizobium TaxID=325217 RepID=UPI0003CFC09E|nr:MULTISPECIES: hypothetical protein [unclassified Mesorhizobium]ESZ07273.1 hypothetical protein X736_13430 [Mesorhizobium sp. L2C089B000]ESZ33859.1 hypothetical protein X733_13775 [Mesorhizobium sp. L2C067A000]WJI53019.1 hypothetical protein NLY44_10280 [Mesorhizobium sp. C089B]